jgi:hypothetical protein
VTAPPKRRWIPAFAGMTVGWLARHSGGGRNPGGLPLIIEMLQWTVGFLLLNHFAPNYFDKTSAFGVSLIDQIYSSHTD